MLEIRMNFGKLVEQINRWDRIVNLDLHFYGIRNEKAAWIIKNHLLGLTKLDKLWVLLEWIDLDMSDKWLDIEDPGHNFGPDWNRLEYLIKDSAYGGLFKLRNTDYENEIGWHETMGRIIKPDEAIETFLGLLQPGTDKQKRMKIGPTARTQNRYDVFKKIKDAHLTRSQSRVAMESCEELQESVTEDTVRNTYRAMGEKWERADRIR